MDKFLVIANWKANKTEQDVQLWSDQLSQVPTPSPRAFTKGSIEIAIAPPSPLIPIVSKLLITNNYPLITSLCAQDVSPHPAGAYTGEVPATLLAALGVKYVLVGHSERRKYSLENTALVEKKFLAATTAGLTPILCAQNEDEIPTNVRNFATEKYLVMYEPLTAISTEGHYHPEPPERINRVLTSWKSKLPEGLRFLYGGSINSQNIGELITSNYSLIAGFVVGHASLDAQNFSDIIKKCLSAINSS